MVENATAIGFWLHGEIKTPPFTATARLEAGFAASPIANAGEKIGLPQVRLMPRHWARAVQSYVFRTRTVTWRILYRLDTDAIVIVAVVLRRKKLPPPPATIVTTAKARLRQYDRAIHGDD